MHLCVLFNTPECVCESCTYVSCAHVCLSVYTSLCWHICVYVCVSVPHSWLIVVLIYGLIVDDWNSQVGLH